MSDREAWNSDDEYANNYVVSSPPRLPQQSTWNEDDMTEEEHLEHDADPLLESSQQYHFLPPKVATTKSAGSTGKRKAKRESQVHHAGNASIFTGNKVKHLKKEDGEPLWRKDIQYDFLKYIFEDKQAVFTNSYQPEIKGKQTFADLYVDAMARSSKTSKILRDKLLSEHEPAKNMAMVCLLVNLGRMNTTLNFFPEMRAQLRTYHAIPSLQAHQDPNSYKQLQDAPRLKSILKGASEDRAEPNTIDKIKMARIPRTNPVNLIFVLAASAPIVTQYHFPSSIDFNDLIMRTTLSSESRGIAFLWLMWHYLESDFTEEGTQENPFGQGIDYNEGFACQGVPRLTILSEAEVEFENIDDDVELTYGREKQRERKRIIEADHAIAAQQEPGPPKRGPKPKLYLGDENVGALAMSSAMRASGTKFSKYDSDVDSTRSTPPPGRTPNTGLGRGIMNPRRGNNPLKNQILGSSSPAPHATPNDHPTSTRRPRPLTAHQIALEKSRTESINAILARGLRKEHHRARKIRRTDGVIYRALMRMPDKVDEFEDSDGEESMSKPPGRGLRSRGPRGLMQRLEEPDDFGEEVSSYAAAFRRMGRRLKRWDDLPADAGPVARGQRNGEKGAAAGDSSDEEVDGMEDSPAIPRDDLDAAEAEVEDDMDVDGDVNMAEGEDDLDDMDREVLGVGSDADEVMDGEDVDGMDADNAGGLPQNPRATSQHEHQHQNGDETEDENIEEEDDIDDDEEEQEGITAGGVARPGNSPARFAAKDEEEDEEEEEDEMQDEDGVSEGEGEDEEAEIGEGDDGEEEEKQGEGEEEAE